MCGIAGWIDWQKDLTLIPTLITSMTETLSHRGPDAGACWSSPHCALGHRRLAIMDPENGHQPMIRHQGEESYVLVYNGEIYNAPELRNELAQHGMKFFTHCDTEVLLNAYIVWGNACVDKLNGIFAFAIWREKAQQLYVARDRLGVKPLFYSCTSQGMWFASEPKAILAHPEFESVVDEQGLAEILTLGPARTPGHGIFHQMNELKPGHAMTYSQQGLTMSKYWQLVSHSHPDDLVTTTRTIKQLLTDCMHVQWHADVPVCTFLSGGLDSSILAALANKHDSENQYGALSTFSLDYINHDADFQPDGYSLSYDEPWAKKMSQYLQSDHHTVNIQVRELIDSLIPSMRARDMPGMADVDSSLYLFCNQVKNKYKVAISGEASDEIFGGYPWFYSQEARKCHTFPWATQLHHRISLIDQAIVSWIKPEQYVHDRYVQALEEVPYAGNESPEQRQMRAMSYLNITRFMPTLLDRKDRMSMAAGLEVRVPFCDHRLIEYVWNIPWDMKNVNQREKGILRQAFIGVIPDEILYRKKSPYPKTHSPIYGQAMLRWLEDILSDSSSPLLQLINKQAIAKLIQSYRNAENFHWFGQLMTIPQLFAYFIQMNEWLKIYKITIR
jgi:asparagine synthase (glutamine-hydrolysing)